MVRVQFVTYACLSTALTAAVVSYAFQTRIQFYPTVIFLVTSKMSLLVLGNMGRWSRCALESCLGQASIGPSPE